MKKLIVFLVTLLVVVANANASRRQMQLEIVDEFWQPVTDITQISIFDAGTSSATAISSDRAGSLTMTNPITTGSTNSTFDQATGFVRWYQTAATYKVTITNGTKTLTIDNMNATFIRFPWHINYIGTAASLSVNDNQSITVGTDSDMVLSWNNGSDFMSWVPASDGSAFNLGTSGVGANVDFNWFVGTALGIKGDEGTATLTIDGVDVLINDTGSKDVNIASSTATGSVTIGSSTSGTLALDTTTGLTINADDSIGITTTGAAADITVDALAGSVIIDGGEAVDDAVVIKSTGAAGGIDIISLGDIDITTTGAAGEDITITNTGGSIAITATEDDAAAMVLEVDGGTSEKLTLHSDQGTGDESILLSSDVGGITVNAAAGSVDIEAVGGTDGDIGINAGDNMTITAAGDLTFAITGTFTVGGSQIVNSLVAVEVEPSTSETVLAADSGRVFTNTAAQGATTFTLPDAAAGLWYVFVDNSSTAGDDVIIDPQAGDNIDHDSNGDAIESVTDAYPQSIIIYALNGTDWATTGVTGTWGQQ